jgi:sugar lactone lactonase YvrE
MTTLLPLLLVLAPCETPTKLPPVIADDAKLYIIYESKGTFFEGPTWDPASEKLFFTAFKGKSTQILRLDDLNKVTVWLDNTQGVNGTYLSASGRLLGAQAYGHRLVSYGIGPDGPKDTRILLEDASLNQPNDVCEAPDGTIYFTDPDFKNAVPVPSTSSKTARRRRSSRTCRCLMA